MEWLLKLLLVSVRVSPLFAGTPVFGSVPVPVSARIVLLVALSCALVSRVPLPEVQLVLLPQWALFELLVGATFAAGLHAGFAAFHFGGRLLDLQIGFGLANLVDFSNNTSMPLIGTALSMVAVLAFLSVDGHHELLRALQLSLVKLPPGGTLSDIDVGAVVAQFGAAFSFGFAVVAPVVLCLLLIDVGMAYMSRTMPQMNVFILSLGVKVFVGLIVLAISLPFAGGVMLRVFDAIFDGWAAVLN